MTPMRLRSSIPLLAFPLMLQAALCDEVQAPSLQSGAIIEISGGYLSGTGVPSAGRRGPTEAEQSYRLIVREVQPIDDSEYYLDECGLQPVTFDGQGTVTYLVYRAQADIGSQLAFNVDVADGNKRLTFCFARSDSPQESACRGMNVPAMIRWDSRDGNVYRGRIYGVLFHPGLKEMINFAWAPITITVPEPGEPLRLDGAGGESSSAKAAEEVTLTKEQACEAIGKRMSITVKSPVDVAAMRSFYAPEVRRLASDKIIQRDEIISLTSKVVESWSQRNLRLIEAGFKGSRLEMVVQYRFSNKQGKTNDSYAKILLDFDRNGQVCGMSEEFSKDRPKLSTGMTPLEYPGEHDVSSED